MPPRMKGTIHILMGPYIMQTKFATIEDGRIIWYESLKDKKVVFPADIEQVPDIIFYFADEDDDKRRHSFFRKKFIFLFYLIKS